MHNVYVYCTHSACAREWAGIVWMYDASVRRNRHFNLQKLSIGTRARWWLPMPKAARLDYYVILVSWLLRFSTFLLQKVRDCTPIVCVLNWIQFNWVDLNPFSLSMPLPFIDFSYLKRNNDDYQTDQYFQLEFAVNRNCNWRNRSRSGMWFADLYFIFTFQIGSPIWMRNWESQFDTLITPNDIWIRKFANKGVFVNVGKLFWFIWFRCSFKCSSKKWVQFCQRRRDSNPFHFVGFPFNFVNENSTMWNDVAHITLRKIENSIWSERETECVSLLV